jgi:hypothetical protein
MSDYFDPTTVTIAAGTRALASQVNAVSAAISAGFDKLPTETELKLGLTRYAVDTGVADAYIVTLPYVPVLTDGFNLSFKAVNANTGACTINVNGTGVKSIVNPDGTALIAGTFGSNAIVIIAYESIGDRYSPPWRRRAQRQQPFQRAMRPRAKLTPASARPTRWLPNWPLRQATTRSMIGTWGRKRQIQLLTTMATR